MYSSLSELSGRRSYPSLSRLERRGLEPNTQRVQSSFLPGGTPCHPPT
jgi:hypothetical protein